jgi:putative phosphoribosyl transferase
MRFADRLTAGEALGEVLVELAPPDPLVLALPRGGVPVGSEVARALGCDLDVLVVRKLGVPFQPELAMGAVAEGGVVIRNDEMVSFASIDEEAFRRVEAVERREMERRLSSYREVAEAIDPSERTAVIVDDGLATGSTAMAGVTALRARHAAEVWVAVPVAPRDTTQMLGREADRVVVLSQPRYFGAVGAWYRDFGQTTDEEVRALLVDSRLR